MPRILASLTLAASLAAPLQAAEETFDHSAFDALLKAHVRQGLVDYDAFARAPSFPPYLQALSKADPARLSDQERLAFWINTYNAYTIALINQHQERKSIRNINKSLGGLVKAKGPWKEQIVQAGKRTLSLDDVEHEIIRKQWKEPRIHFVLVCAALGCPPLRSEAFTGARLLAQLDEQSRLFLLKSPEKNRVDVAANTVHVSMIFDYYKEDFGTTDAAIGRYLAQFHPPGKERSLLLSGTFRLQKTDYDWSLNSQGAR